MKKRMGVVALCAAAVMIIAGCNNNSEELQKQVSQLQNEASTLHQTIAERDKHLDEAMQAVNEIYKEIEQARSKEAQLVERTGGSEGPAQLTGTDTRQKLMQNITAIGTTLKENRKKLNDLQSKLKASRSEFASLNTLVESLKKSLGEREQSIAMLETRVQGLEATVAENTRTIQEKEAVIDQQQRTMKTGYYIVGTRDELKEKGIITDEGGFPWGLFGSTTVMASGVDRSLFTPIDKNTDQTIHVNGEIDEILPRRNQEFFAMGSQDEHFSDLTIVKPEGFWQDNYLVIVVN